MRPDRPILYSFRRCPYAMRARLALHASGLDFEHRDILLRDKPASMLAASPKGTVPVLIRPDGSVLEESLDIMRWALGENDPDDWLGADPGDTQALIAMCDGTFKHHLDRYKYATRYDDADPDAHHAKAVELLYGLEDRLAASAQLTGPQVRLADIALFPFIRQFANADRSRFDALPLPALQAWLEAHVTSDRFAAIMRKQPLWQDPTPSN
ncbi:MAG: glutathione S-transferase [Maricaulis sp.]|nr:glutathione S-transferase [Maricaulis sp.]